MIVDYYVAKCRMCGEDRATKLYRKGDDGEKHWHDMCSTCERRAEKARMCELPEDPSEVKQCPSCMKNRPATCEYFYHNVHGKYGLDTYCIPCHREQTRSRYYRSN